MSIVDSIATFRLLRACASLGLVTCDDGLTFSATPLLGTLRTKVPGSLHSLAIAWSGPGHWLSWGRFLDAVRTGESQTGPAPGVALWDYYAQRPEESAAFTSAMHGASQARLKRAFSAMLFLGGFLVDVPRWVVSATKSVEKFKS